MFFFLVVRARCAAGRIAEFLDRPNLHGQFAGSSEDIARTVFAHPTLSEGIHEAALAVDERALHISHKRRR